MADKWDDDKIESLLNDFPDIEDDRTKEQVHAKLFPPEKTKKQVTWPRYLIAAVVFIGAAGLLYAMLTSNGSFDMATDTSTSEDSSDGSNELYQQSESAEETDSPTADSANESAESGNSATSMVAEERTAVYADDLEGHVPFTIGLTENAVVVPITFLVPAEDVEGQGPVELYEQLAPLIDETALGFDEYHPYAGALASEGAAIEHRLPDDHTYDLASASINVYLESLLTTFGEAEVFRIFDEEGAPAEFDQVGPLEDITPAEGGMPFYQFTLNNGTRYFIPDWNGDYESGSAALEALATSPNDLQQATVPESIGYSVRETEGQLIVAFDSLDLASLPPAEVMRMIESMSLTAGSYGKELLFEGLVQSDWSGFDFTSPIPIPVAPNRLDWNS